MSPLPRALAPVAALLAGLLTLAAAPAPGPAPMPSPGVDRAGMNPAVAPGENFFAYANGTWVKTTEIPADRARWGVGAIVAQRTDRRTADLIQETAAGRPPAGSEGR